jgi:phosphatidate cytidylyltransferase
MNFLKRALTGGLFGTLVFGTIFIGATAFLIFYLIIMIIALLEFYRLAGNNGLKIQKYTAIIFSIAIFFLFHGYSAGHIPVQQLSLIFLFPLVFMIKELYRKSERPFDNLVWTLFGHIYIVLPLSMLNFLVFPGEIAGYKYNPYLLAGILVLIMVNDTAAYLVGVPLGRHRLFKKVSPKKSWEGTIGGALAVLAAALFINRFVPLLETMNWLIIGSIVLVSGVYGDLVESLYKRGQGVKDSGSLLPGHGGILDRIDAWLFVIPAVWVYLNFIL